MDWDKDEMETSDKRESNRKKPTMAACNKRNSNSKARDKGSKV